MKTFLFVTLLFIPMMGVADYPALRAGYLQPYAGPEDAVPGQEDCPEVYNPDSLSGEDWLHDAARYYLWREDGDQESSCLNPPDPATTTLSLR